MSHLDEFVLNEYADGVLAAAEAGMVEQHLADCPECRAQLTELQDLFTALASVGEVALTADLRHRVLAEIKPPSLWWSPWLIAVQGITAVLLAVWLWPTAETWLTTSSGLAETGAAWWAQLLLSGESVLVGLTSFFEQSETSLISLNLPAEQWLWLMGLGLLVWLVGNGLFLKPRRGQIISN